MSAYEPTITVKQKEAANVPPDATRYWIEVNGVLYSVLMNREQYRNGDFRWHISVSKNDDLAAKNHEVPVWRDFVAIIHFLRPGVPFALGIPPRNQWMNVNPNVLHAVETKDTPIVEQWRETGAAVRGTGAGVPT